MWLSLVGLVGGAAAYGAMFGMNFTPKWMLIPAAITPVLFLGACWLGLKQAWANRKRAKNIAAEIRCVDHPATILKKVLGDLQQKDLASLPLPSSGDQDCRYELLGRLQRVLKSLQFVSMTVLVDRVDEPSRISGDARKMKHLIWPLFSHKFLQQDGVGIKMLLPIELGYELKKEDADFYSRARLDKSNLIERLEWTGVTLFDICSKRLSSVYEGDGQAPSLNDLFEDNVHNQEIIEALDQMKQPRDAFKFFYDLLQQHCQNATDDDPAFLIPKLTLDQVRRKQAQRVTELARGYSAA
jgi:hypothetical protein